MFPPVTKTVAFDHLKANYAMSEAVKKSAAVLVKNDPREFSTAVHSS